MNAYTAGCYGVPVVFLTRHGLLQELLPRRPAGEKNVVCWDDPAWIFCMRDEGEPNGK